MDLSVSGIDVSIWIYMKTKERQKATVDPACLESVRRFLSLKMLLHRGPSGYPQVYHTQSMTHIMDNQVRRLISLPYFQVAFKHSFVLSTLCNLLIAINFLNIFQNTYISNAIVKRSLCQFFLFTKDLIDRVFWDIFSCKSFGPSKT